MPRQVEFIFDFGSPNAYLAYHVLQPLARRLGAEMVITPCLLGGIFKLTDNRSPMEAFGAVKGKLDYERLEMQRFITRHGLSSFRFNPHFPVNTLLVMRGLVAAQRQGQEGAYLPAVLKAMWEDGRKMDDPETVAQLLSDAGLDGPGLLAMTQDPAVKQRLMDNTQAAVDRGVFGIPTFFVGDEMFFGKDRLGQVEEALAAQAG